MAKENTATQFAAYIWLLDIIYNQGPISKEEIVRRYENNGYINPDGNTLTDRTFHRWRNDIEQLFDVNIVCSHNRGNCYSIAQEEDLRKEGVKMWLLNSFSLRNIVNESDSVAQQILVEEVPSGQRFLTDIVRAIKDGVAVEMTYQGFEKVKSSTFNVEPYCLKLFHQRWYVYGRSVFSDENRLYALDRIQNINLTSDHFTLPKGFDAGALFADRYGVSMKEGPKQTVRVRVDASQVKYFMTLPIHSSQKIVEQTEEYSVIEFNIIPTYELKQELRKYGPEIEVLEPLWLRKEFLNDAKRVVETHKSK